MRVAAIVSVPLRGMHVTVLKAASAIAAIWSVLTAGLHLWPFDGHHALEVMAPTNLGILLWLPVAGAAFLTMRTRQFFILHLPGVGVWAFMAVALASVSFSPHVMQSATSVAKLALMYVGAYTLYRLACSGRNGAARLCLAALIAACIAMAACGMARLGGFEGVGFFGNPHKYGTAVSILLTLGLVSQACQERPWGWVVVLVAVAGGLTFWTLGGLAGLLAGLGAGAMATRKTARRRLVICLLAVVATTAMCWRTPVLSGLRADVQVAEVNNRDIRQRYIEWQAELNMLEARPVTGTGLGCVNEYRSMFYGRLPKLNTLDTFDRNGWLLLAAETGVFGLIAFVWLVSRAGCAAWQAARGRANQGTMGATAFAALIAGCVANVFSSFNYNGVLNVFVLTLALAHSVRLEPTDTLSTGKPSSNVTDNLDSPSGIMA